MGFHLQGKKTSFPSMAQLACISPILIVLWMRGCMREKKRESVPGQKSPPCFPASEFSFSSLRRLLPMSYSMNRHACTNNKTQQQINRWMWALLFQSPTHALSRCVVFLIWIAFVSICISLHLSLTCHLHFPFSPLLLPISTDTKIMSVSESSKPSKSAKLAEPLPGQEYATQVPPIVNPSGKPKLPFTREEIDALSMPKVLISGGGIGGLTLALLLYKANIPFLVLERAKEIKSLGKRPLHQITYSLSY